MGVGKGAQTRLPFVVVTLHYITSHHITRYHQPCGFETFFSFLFGYTNNGFKGLCGTTNLPRIPAEIPKDKTVNL